MTSMALGVFMNIVSPSVAIGIEKSIMSSLSTVIEKSAITISMLFSMISSTIGYVKEYLL